MCRKARSWYSDCGADAIHLDLVYLDLPCLALPCPILHTRIILYKHTICFFILLSLT